MEKFLSADRRLYTLVHLRWRYRPLDRFMVLLTNVGTKGAIWLLIVAILELARVPRAGDALILVCASLLFTLGIINLVLKPLVARQRPYEGQAANTLLIGRQDPHSWPSAHSGSAMAAATALAAVYPPWSPLIFLLGFAIGYSRVYVGVHFPVDVLAGFAVGLVAAGIVLAIGLLFGLPV